MMVIWRHRKAVDSLTKDREVFLGHEVTMKGVAAVLFTAVAEDNYI